MKDVIQSKFDGEVISDSKIGGLCEYLDKDFHFDNCTQLDMHTHAQIASYPMFLLYLLEVNLGFGVYMIFIWSVLR